MKTGIILFFSFLLNFSFSLYCNAQDVIVLKTGDEILSIVNEIGIDAIKYKKFDNPEGPIYTIEKSKVFMIKYQNGSKDVFTVDEEKVAVPEPQVTPPAPAPTKPATPKPLVYKRGIRLDNKILTEKEIYALYSNYPEARKLYDKGESLKSAGSALSWGTIGIMFYGIYKGTKINDQALDNINAKRTLIGAGLCQLTSWIFSGSGNSNVSKSVDLYNAQINK